MRGDALKRKRNNKGRISAWLVTWGGTGEHAKRKDKIAAILNYRQTSNKISEIIEMIYANETYTLEERLYIAKNKKLNPYPAEIFRTQQVGRICCGHNPYLEARLVDNLHVIKDKNGNQKLEWDEREKPDIDTN